MPPARRRAAARRGRRASAGSAPPSPRWSRVTAMPSPVSRRTTASASGRVSPATNRCTTCRVTGVPTSTRRSAGRREAPSSTVLVESTGPPPSRTSASASTLGSARAARQGQTYGVVSYDRPVRDELQDIVDEVARLLGAPATLEDRDFTLLAFAAHPLDDAATAMEDVRTRSILGRSPPPAPPPRAPPRPAAAPPPWAASPPPSTRGRAPPPPPRRWFEDLGIARAEGPL